MNYALTCFRYASAPAQSGSICASLVDQNTDRRRNNELGLLGSEPGILYDLPNSLCLLFLISHDRQKSMQPDIRIYSKIFPVFQAKAKIVFHSAFLLCRKEDDIYVMTFQRRIRNQLFGKCNVFTYFPAWHFAGKTSLSTTSMMAGNGSSGSAHGRHENKRGLS
jgi:hypothetical protein